MDQNSGDKDDFLTAVGEVKERHKPKSKQQKEKKEKLITVKDINSYKSNEIAVNVNKFLGGNIHKDAGEVLFGENLARAGEYYGLKATPLWGLLISGLGLGVVIFRVIMKKKGQQPVNTVGGDLNKL